MKRISASFFRKGSFFFILFPLIALILIPIVIWGGFLEPFSEVKSLKSPSTAPFFSSTVLLISLGTLLFYFFFSSFRQIFKKGQQYRIDILIAFVYSIGFANLIFGFISSFIGHLLFFILGLILGAGYQIAKKKKPLLYPRNLLLIIAFFILYAAISIFLSPDKGKGFDTFRLIIWLLIIPLLFSFYPPTQRTLQHFSRFAIGIGYIYVIGVLYLYILASVFYSSPLDAAFHLDKTYFLTSGGISYSPHFLIQGFANAHYTFILFVLSAPLMHALLKGHSRSRIIAYALSLLLFSHVIQSRLWIILLPLLIGAAWLHRRGNRKQIRIIYGSFLGIAILFLAFATKNSDLFKDNTRTELLSLALEEANEKVVLGHGLATADPFLESKDMCQRHFHNSFIQVYFEMGLIGLLFTLLILATYATICVKRKNFAGILLCLSAIGLMTTDEIVNTTILFFDILLIMSLYLYLKGDDSHILYSSRKETTRVAVPKGDRL